MQTRFFLLCASLVGIASAAVTNVRVLGTTATQAVLAYTAPDLAPCAVVVSESATYSPAVNDVNASLFAGADQDSRAGNVSNGRERVFVAGRRAAEGAADGKLYSRALQAYTAHYYRITCGADTATGSFRTTNVPLGNTYPDPYPVDPDRPGEYSWPTVPETVNTAVIDPQTGVYLKRITGPKSYLHSGYSNVASLGAFDDANMWSIAVGDVLPADYSATGGGCSPTCPKMYVPADPSSYSAAAFLPRYAGTDIPEVVQLDWITLRVTGTVTGTGEDAKIVACLTLDGVNCVSGAATAELSLESCASGCTLGDSTSYLRFWFGGAIPSFAGPDIAKRSTTASYNNSSGDLTWTSGDYFNLKWAAGTRVWISGTPYRTTVAGSLQTIRIASGLGLANPTVVGQSFGVLLWKKTATNGTAVHVSDVRFNFGSGYSFASPSQSSLDYCNGTETTYQGRPGYRCVLTTSNAGDIWVWTDKETGDTNALGLAYVPAKVGADGWGSTQTLVGQANVLKDPNTVYGIVNDASSRKVMIEARYTGDNSPMPGNSIPYGSAGYIFSDANVRNLTPGSAGKDLPSLIAAFDSRFVNAALYPECKTFAINAGKALAYCRAGQDRTPGAWVIVFDPSIDALTGNPVVAAIPTSGIGAANPTPCRWCVHHTPSGTVDDGWVLIGVKSDTSDTGGYFRTTTTAAIPGTATETCPTGGTGCTTIGVSGEPLLDAARAGDVALIDSERVEIVQKISSTSWLVRRGYAGTAIAAHSTVPANVKMLCAGEAQYTPGSGIRVWWNYAADAHAYNASGNTVGLEYDPSGHGAYKPQFFSVQYNTGIRTRIGGPERMSDPYDTFVELHLPFAGKLAYNWALQSHSSRGQWQAATAWEKQWILDSHQFIEGASVPVTITAVSGQLYKVSRALNRKHLPTFAWCGVNPLKDISGPGSAITDATADTYKYCVANAAGECRGNSAAGDIYVNCPELSKTSCNISIHTQMWTTGNYDSNRNNTRDVCVFDGLSKTGATLVQMGTLRSDNTGNWSTRRITSAFSRWRRQSESIYTNGIALPDGRWALVVSRWLDGQRSDWFAAKLPPFPQADSNNRATFLPLVVDGGAVPAGTQNAIVEFGYDPLFRCTSRDEACVSVTGGSTPQPVNEAAPYSWAGDGGWSGVACASGCSITVPVISQRVVYYRLKYRNASSQVIATSATQVAATQ